jgi:hypothetical protein
LAKDQVELEVQDISGHLLALLTEVVAVEVLIIQQEPVVLVVAVLVPVHFPLQEHQV